MARQAALVDGVEKIVVIVRQEVVGVDNKLLFACKHLHLSLHPVGFGYRELLAFVCLDLMDDVILPVKIHAEADSLAFPTLQAYLPVPSLNAQIIENTMLIGGPCRRVLVTEVPLGNAELDIPPPGKGVGVPVSHDHGTI